MSGARLVINDSISCQVESFITDKGEVEARQERTENSLQTFQCRQASLINIHTSFKQR